MHSPVRHCFLHNAAIAHAHALCIVTCVPDSTAILDFQSSQGKVKRLYYLRNPSNQLLLKLQLAQEVLYPNHTNHQRPSRVGLHPSPYCRSSGGGPKTHDPTASGQREQRPRTC